VHNGRIVAATGVVLLVVLYAVAAGVWVGSGSAFYGGLDAPPWQPPDVVFGLIWPYNFVVFGVAGVLVALRGSSRAVGWWLVLSTASVGAALAWAYMFYVNEALWPAAVSLGVATSITVPVVIITWRTVWWSGVLLLPYVLWLATATSLAVGYAVRNPGI